MTLALFFQAHRRFLHALGLTGEHAPKYVIPRRDGRIMILGVEIFLIFLAVVFIDSRLHKIRKIESEVLKELQLVNGSQREIVKALQWMVDN